MRIYIAADFARAGEADAVAAVCTAAGHEVASRWHAEVTAAERSAAGRMGGPDQDAALAAAMRNISDLDSAEVLVLLTTGEPARGGRHFETGYAYRAGIPIMVVGPIEHAFHRLALTRTTSIDCLAEALAEVESAAGIG